MTQPAVRIPVWTLGDRLRKARQDAGLEQRDLAEAMGLSPSTIGTYEKGVTPPKLLVLKAWALATGVPVEWLQEGRVTRYKRDTIDIPLPVRDRSPVTVSAA
jgi:transcriptional regulator with XRE-family HTH domain